MPLNPPFPALLQTNDPPNPNEQAEVRLLVEETKAALDEIRYHPSRLSLTSYLNNVWETSDFLDAHRGIISPLRYYPPELLIHIFLHTLPSPRRLDDIDIQTWIDRADSKTILALSQTCRYWRDLALSTPQLWTTFPTIISPRSYSSGFLELMKLHVERSANLPVHISFYIPYPYDPRYPDQRDEWSLHSNPAIDLVLTQSKCWQTAFIHMDHTLFHLLSGLETGVGLPALEMLYVKCRFRWSDFMDYTGPRDMFMNAPHLRHAFLDSHQASGLINLPWNQITTYIGLPEELETLRASSEQLAECTIRGPLSNVQSPSTPLQFPKLTTLTVARTNYRTPYHFGHQSHTTFRHMITPNITSLTITDQDPKKCSDSPLIINDLLSRTLSSPSKLVELVFKVGGLTSSDLTRLLGVTPLLRGLRVLGASPSFVSSLVAKTEKTPNGSSTPLVPHLIFLQIESPADREAQPLVDLYDSRHLAAECGESVGKIYVELKFSSYSQCIEMQDHIEGWSELLEAENALKGSQYRRFVGWRKHLAKHFFRYDPDKQKQYGVPGKQPSSRLKMLSDGHIDKVLSEIENCQPANPVLLEASRLPRLFIELVLYVDDNAPAFYLSYKYHVQMAKLFIRWLRTFAGKAGGRRWQISADRKLHIEGQDTVPHL